jgi:hypothetical protein
MPDEMPPADPSSLPGDVEFRLQTANIPLPSVTTAQQNLTYEGQRKINAIWEYTQASIALLLVGAAVVCGIKICFDPSPGREIPTILSTLGGMVVGSYFQRTNHTAIGGIGPRPSDQQGR